MWRETRAQQDRQWLRPRKMIPRSRSAARIGLRVVRWKVGVCIRVVLEACRWVALGARVRRRVGWVTGRALAVICFMFVFASRTATSNILICWLRSRKRDFLQISDGRHGGEDSRCYVSKLCVGVSG